MPVTWLHLSDMHLSPSNPYERHVILKALVESVEHFRLSREWVPDLVFATGDIAEKGAAAVFKENGPTPSLATTFFDDLLRAAKLGRERLFVVPGNHDVERGNGTGLERTLSTAEKVDQYFAPGAKQRHNTDKFEAFRSWYNSYFNGAGRCFPDNTTVQLYPDIVIDSHKLAILGLNSSLFCEDSETDHGKLLIGLRCLDSVFDNLKISRSELTIALMHHPLDWLSHLERTKVKAALRKNQVHLFLQGYYHETEVEPGMPLQLAAGAAYQTDHWPKSALFCRYVDGAVTVYPLKYQDSPNRVWTLDTGVYPKEKGFVKTYVLVSESAELTIDSSNKYKEELHRYQTALKNELGTIRILGLSGIERIDVNLDEQTFVPLRFSRRRESHSLTGEGVPGERSGEEALEPDKVMRLAFEHRRMLLVIGDAGAGKTTLLQYYALSCLDGLRFDRLGFKAPVNVFYLPLREVEQVHSLPENLAMWAKRHHRAISATAFEQWLGSGNTLVLFDGLDEIGITEERKQMCGWIDGAWSGFEHVRFVVTSRRSGYRKEDGVELKADYEQVDVLDFTAEQQERFLKNWFNAALLRDTPDEGVSSEEWPEMARARAEAKTVKIIAHLKEEKNRGLKQIAAIPMILQIMAILWKRDEYLPDTREKLYSSVLDYLLELRDKHKNLKARMSAERSRMVLEPVALWMQEELKKDEIGCTEMQERMQKELDVMDGRNFTPPSAEEFCRHLVDRAALLVELGTRSKTYLFRHKTFREYLAGVDLVRQVLRDPKRFDAFVADFGKGWSDEMLRTFMANADAETFDLVMDKLFDERFNLEWSQKQRLLLFSLIDEAKKRKIDSLSRRLLQPNTVLRQFMMLDCLNEIGIVEAVESLKRFGESGFAEDNKVKERAEEISTALINRSEKRRGSVSSSATPYLDHVGRLLPLFENSFEKDARYILIPGNGSDVSDMYFAKYPVTNRLYRRFIDYLQSKHQECEALFAASEFNNVLQEIAKNKTWDTGFATYLKEGKNDLAGLFRSGHDDDRKFGGDDQPVVSITWYAARSYCLWLSLVESKGTQTDLYRLPMEPEWKWAAAGKENREYPWGNAEPTPRLANYDGSNIGATTPVGSYPEGATPEGLYDMAGNVWEWQENRYGYKDYPDVRALRGGSWVSDAGYLRCSSQGDYVPGVRFSYVGFRVLRPSPLLKP
jgi:formylglycine-generating enzyme required for sulfatase activity